VCQTDGRSEFIYKIVGLLLWEAVKWEREVNVSFYRILYVIINAFG